MDIQQQYFLRRNNLHLYNMNADDLIMLQKAVAEELSQRQDIRNKELKYELAKKVEAETGNDQHSADPKEELFLARRQYALRISQFDELRHVPGYAQRNYDGTIAEASDELTYDGDKRLKPLSDAEMNKLSDDYERDYNEKHNIPQWKITTIENDGSEKTIGYS